MELLIQLAFIAILLVIGLVVGGMVERRHFSSLAMREADLKLVMVFNEKTPPANVEYRDAFLVAGSVVLGEDYFKRFAASLRSFFGGNMRMYESLMDRGRREAILRMNLAGRPVVAPDVDPVINPRAIGDRRSEGRVGDTGFTRTCRRRT